MTSFCCRCGAPLASESHSYYCDKHGGLAPTPGDQIRCPFCRELILAGAKKCSFCGEFLNEPLTKAPVRTMARANDTTSSSKQSGANHLSRRVGSWVGRHPVWMMLLLLLSIGYIGRSAVEKKQGDAQQNPSEVSGQPAEDSTPRQQQRAAASESVERDSGITTKQREDIAGLLNKSFQDQDVEVSVFAGGSENDELFLSSELLKDPAGRTNILHLIRTNWQDQLCKAGFKTIVLSDSSILGIPRDYPLRCPWKAKDRAILATSIKDDLLKGGMAGTVQASGQENEILSIVTNYEAFSSSSARAAFFQQMRQGQFVTALCERGFRQVSIQYSASPKAISRFDLKCGSDE
jgi:hypothetical protein